LTKEMDFVGYDNYPVWGDMNAPFPYYFNTFVMSYLRGLKKNKPFTLFEQYSDFQGHTCLGYRASVSETVFWTNHAIAHGANQVLYFRWRTAPYGQEQLCHGILGPDNQETGVYRGLQENIRGFAQSMQGFANVPVASDACVLYDADNARVLTKQNLSKELSFSPVPYMQAGYLKELARYFVPFSILSVNADVCSVASVDLDKYRLIVLPLYQMTDPTFVERLTKWVEAGGILVLGYRSGARNMLNHSVDAPLPGCFADLAGVHVESFESLNEEKVRIRIGAVPSQGEIWADVLQPVQAKAIAYYRDRRKHYNGRACMTVNKVGDGQVFYMGTAPGKAGLLYLYWKFLRTANLRARFWGPGIEMVRRQDEEGNDLDVVLNHNPRRAWVRGRWIPAHGARVLKV
jgi:beta-galactosidase